MVRGLLVLFLLNSVAWAIEDNWVNIDTEGLIQLQKNSFIADDGLLAFWIKLNKPTVINGAQIQYQVAYNRVDCVAKKMSLERVITFDSEDKVVNTLDFELETGRKMPLLSQNPGSGGELLLNSVCSALKQAEDMAKATTNPPVEDIPKAIVAQPARKRSGLRDFFQGLALGAGMAAQARANTPRPVFTNCYTNPYTGMTNCTSY